MRNKLKILMVLLSCSSFSISTHAQTQVFACQNIITGGLEWKNSTWKLTRFTPSVPFFLKITSGRIDGDSVGKALGLNDSFYCKRLDPPFMHIHHCSHQLGSTLMFNQIELKGGTSIIYASTQKDSEEKDDLILTTFTCQKM